MAEVIIYLISIIPAYIALVCLRKNLIDKDFEDFSPLSAVVALVPAINTAIGLCWILFLIWDTLAFLISRD